MGGSMYVGWGGDHAIGSKPVRNFCFFSSRRRHTRYWRDWSSDVCSSDLQEGPSTTHLTVADRKGNVVAYTLTIEQTGGIGIVVPGRGFLLNNELTDFEPATGLRNSPEARKRPRSSISPTIVTRDRHHRPVPAVGSPGAATIIRTVAEILVNRCERGLTLPESIAHPRVANRNGPRSDAEPTFAQSLLATGLRARGHEFAEVPEIG